MKLNDFVVDFEDDVKIRVMEKEDLLYEGDIQILSKMLSYNIKKGSAKFVDGVLQIELNKYSF